MEGHAHESKYTDLFSAHILVSGKILPGLNSRCVSVYLVQHPNHCIQCTKFTCLFAAHAFQDKDIYKAAAEEQNQAPPSNEVYILFIQKVSDARLNS
jgi:hypothetical protein